MKVPRILVVDDEPDVEALISQRFRRKVRKGELELVFAHDGQHALEVLNENPDVDIVLSDINMPRMDGLTLLERLGELESDLQTVMVSAYGDMRNIRSAMNRGAFDFVTKPIEFDDLEATIEKTLEHLRMLRDLQAAKANAEHAHLMLSRYFSPSVAEALSQNPEAMLSGERREATFLFTDLENFTPLVEATSAETVVGILNEYLDGITETIFNHGGTVMKIIGDAVQAIFGAPVAREDHAGAAVQCALALDEFATGFKDRMNTAGIALGKTRIGVNSGSAIIGNFGGQRFFDYTAYGDAVNIAARLEQANKIFGTRICISESVVDQIPDFQGRPVGTLRLKGKEESIRTFEPLPAEKVGSEAMQAYRDAFALLEAQDPKARQAFAALVGAFDEDPLTMFHLGRLLRGEAGAEIS
ncbi:adenylate/guanylate cyclase domain-containing protein [Ruegeria marina]|uniref:Response regulator receiver domain-containing protein n=1 Tax=Ruegeria marina TaxID=639004 RepID=A0A1G6VUG2_9RHOB|nr:adenylate/guanylate cyclase domain-containing protein [Ruegeria marina]SDD56476.1 Response regulator receiver domain-containing protein [Ruegeria marina]